MPFSSHMNPPTGAPARRPHLLVSLLRNQLTVPLWALPFAIFFGVLNGGAWRTFVLSYQISLVFTSVIRASLWGTERWVAPRIARSFGDSEMPWMVNGALYSTSSVLASFFAAWLVQVFVWHHFMSGPNAWLVTGSFALLFTTLFSSIVYARLFYRQAMERGAQVERIRGELARAELRALRSQVNPHFLFNTLNAIASLIAEDPAAAEDVVTRLAEVFRYALTSSERDTASLGEELEFGRAYLSIERVRLGDRLRVVEDIDAALLGAKVPSLLLQPLVENAVRYAVAPRPEGGTIRIEARRRGDALELVVADDGPGLPATPSPQGHGVGLESVRERLRLAGPGHRFEIQSEPGTGTRLTLTLPLVS